MEIVFQVSGLMNYGYGTAILSGTTLVTPSNSLIVLCLMGFASVASRLAAIWLLEVVPDVSADEGEEEGILMVKVGKEVSMDLGGKSAEESKVNLLGAGGVERKKGPCEPITGGSSRSRSR
jgi:hypothetical protein